MKLIKTWTSVTMPSIYLIGGKVSGGNVACLSSSGQSFNRKTFSPATFYPETFEPLFFNLFLLLSILFFGCDNVQLSGTLQLTIIWHVITVILINT